MPIYPKHTHKHNTRVARRLKSLQFSLGESVCVSSHFSITSIYFFFFPIWQKHIFTIHVAQSRGRQYNDSNPKLSMTLGRIRNIFAIRMMARREFPTSIYNWAPLVQSLRLIECSVDSPLSYYAGLWLKSVWWFMQRGENIIKMGILL